MESQGKGTIMVETKKYMKFNKHVLLVPNLKENILSNVQMMENEYFVHFEKNTNVNKANKLRIRISLIQN